MKSVIRIVVLVAMSLGMLFGSASAASAGDPICDRVLHCGPCPPGTTHRIGPICFG